MANGVTNLEIQQQITDMYRQQNQLLVAQARLMRGQLAIQTELAAVMQNIDPDELERRLAPLNAQLDQTISNLESMASSGQASFGALASGAGSTTESIDALGDAFINAGGAAQNLGGAGIVLEGMRKGVDLVAESFTSVGNIVSTVWQGVKDLGTTVLGALLGPFQMLMDQARALPVNTEFFQAREAVREFFGSLATNEGAAVIDMFQQIQKGIGETGLTARRILGDRAAQLRAMNELAQGLGATFTAVLDAGLIKNTGNVVAFQKGLGITNDEMKEFGRVALTSGRSIDEVLRETANYAIRMGKAFGISSKLIGRDMATMQADLKRFGGLGAKAFSEVSVYARKLGLEVKSLTGIMDTFDNLDSAAQAAARLNQQFGIQIDTLGMLEEENPARRADMLREALNRAGVSYTDLDRRSKSYLATQIGMSEADAELLFNAKNRGLSLDEIKKRSESAEKNQLSQAEATKLLADNIQRLAQNMANLTEGGIFDQLIQGFMDGIMRSAEMRNLLRQVREVMVLVYRTGVQLGRMFVDLFPGIRDIIGGYADIFNPTRWGKSFGQIREAVREFFKAITVDPETGLRNLWTKLKEIFFGHMDASTPGGIKLIEGFKKFFGTILRVIVAAARVIIPELLKSLTEGVRYLNQLLKGEGGGLGIDISGLWTSLKTSFIGLFEQLGELFTVILPPLWNAFVEALTELGNFIWPRIKAWFEDNWETILLGLAAIFAGPSIISAIVSGLGALFSGALSNLFSGGMSDMLAGVSGEMPGGGNPVQMFRKATETGQAVNDSIGPLGSLLNNSKAIGALLAGLGALVLSIKLVAIDMKNANLTAGDVMGAVLAMGAAGLLLAGLVYMAQNLGPQEALGAAIAALSALVFNWVGSDVIQSFVRIVREDLLGPNGIIVAVKGFAQDLVNKIPNLSQLKAGFEVMEQVGTFLSSMSGFLVGGTITGAIDTATSALGSAASGVGTRVNNIRTGIADFVQNVPLVGGALASAVRPEQIAQNNQELQKAPDQVNRFAQIMGDMGSAIAAFVKGVAPIQAMGDITPLMKSVSVILESLSIFLKETFPVLQDLASSSKASVGFIDAIDVISRLTSSVASFIAAVVESIANVNENMINALKVMPSLFNAVADSLVKLAPTLPSFQVAENAPRIDFELISLIFGEIATFFTSFVNSARDLAGVDAGQIASIASLYETVGSDVLGGLANVLSILINSDLIEMSGNEDQIKSFTNFLKETLGSLFNGFGDAFAGVFRELQTITTVLTAEQASILSTLVPLFGIVLNGLNDMLKAITGLIKAGLGAGGIINNDIVISFLTLTQELFNQIKNLLPDLLKSINDSFVGVDVEGLASKIPIFTQILGIFTTVVDVVGNIRDLAKSVAGETGSVEQGILTIYRLFNSNEGAGIDIFDIIQSIIEGFRNINVDNLPGRATFQKMSTTLESLIGITASIKEIKNNEITGNISIEPIEKIFKTIGSENFKNAVKSAADISITAMTNVKNSIEKLVEISRSLKEIADTAIPSTINQTFTNINSALSSFGTLRIPATFPSQENLSLIQGSMSSVVDIAETLSRAVNSIESGTNEAIAELLNGLADNIDLLNNIRPVSISTSLSQLASSIGLGSSESLTITNRNFTLQVNMTIRIDAETIERAIVSNPDGTLVITRGEFENNVTPPGFRSVERGPRRANVARG